MASTWSALKIELLETGANSGTWGTATNVNLGDAVLGEVITGSATVNFPSAADVTITLTDSATTQSARNLRLNITESGAGVGYAGNLILGSGCQIEKFYLIRNNGTGVKTIKNTTGTGVAVAAGKATLVYNDGTNVVDVLNSFSSAILGAENAGSIIPFYFANQAAFPSASTYHGAIAHSHADGAMYFAHSGAWVRMLNDSGPLGTPSSGTATNLTGLPLTTGVTGTLPVANGGTALTTGTSGGVLAYTASGTLASSGVLAQYGVVIGGGAGAVPTSTAVGTATHVLTSNGAGYAPTFQALPAAGVTTFTAGTTGFTPNTATSGAVTLAGTLNVANGGTGLSTTTAYSVVFSGTTSTGAFQASAGPGTTGHVLTSNGAGALPTFQAAASSGATKGQAIVLSMIFG